MKSSLPAVSWLDAVGEGAGEEQCAVVNSPDEGSDHHLGVRLRDSSEVAVFDDSRLGARARSRPDCR